jgi:hypothetical protein
MIPLCWVNLPFGQNHPTYLKFVVSMYFAITSQINKFGGRAQVKKPGKKAGLGVPDQGRRYFRLVFDSRRAMERGLERRPASALSVRRVRLVLNPHIVYWIGSAMSALRKKPKTGQGGLSRVPRDSGCQDKAP